MYQILHLHLRMSCWGKRRRRDGHGYTRPSDVELKLKMDLGTWGKAMKDNDDDGNINGVTLVGAMSSMLFGTLNVTG